MEPGSGEAQGGAPVSHGWQAGALQAKRNAVTEWARQCVSGVAGVSSFHGMMGELRRPHGNQDTMMREEEPG